MTKAGDLMLYDAGNSLEQDSGEIRPTKLTATDEGDHVSKFRIRGIGDSCVLPFSQYYKYTIELPSGDKFALVWGKDVDWRNLQATRDILRAEYRIRSISAPDEDEGKKNSRDFDIKLHPRPWILRVQDSTILYVKDKYRYRLLHRDLLSDVDVAVDIHDGKEYAIKSIREVSKDTRPPLSFEDMLSQLKVEVEISTILSDPHLLTPEHDQGWEHRRGPEIFYALYDCKVVEYGHR
ncbi:hypothetical protein MY11210_006423 [Beauveria gryllotalpidicola]